MPPLNLWDLLPVAIYVCESPTGLIRYYNRRAADLWGRTPRLNDTEDRFCGSHRLYWPDGRYLPHDQTPMARALAHGESAIAQDVVIERPDGSRITVQVNIAPLHDQQGRLLGAVNVFQDISTRKSEEDRVRESEERFRSLTACSPVGIFLTGVDGRCTYTNERCQKICGFTAEEALGEGWARFVHPLDRAEVFTGWTRTALEGREYAHEFRWQHPDGKVRWTYIRTAPVVTPAGELLGHVGTVEDITESRQVQEDLLYQSRLTRTISDNADSCLFMMDANGYPTYMNSAAVAVTGYTLVEIQDRPLHESIHHTRSDGRPYPIAECPIDSALPRGQNIGPYEDLFVRKDGSFFPVLAKASPIIRDGVPIGTVVEVRDITVQKQAEREREQLLQELQEERRRLELSQQELQERLSDLETFHDVAVGRELKMIELEREIEQLRQRLAGLEGQRSS